MSSQVLPYDLLIQILVRLPVKSLLCFSFYRDDGETLTKYQELEFPIKNEYYHYRASCNGLLCFSHYFRSRMSLALWNPSIRTFYRFPGPAWPTTHVSYSNVGVGYDRLTNEYKILILTFSMTLDYEHPNSFYVEVLVLGMDEWRRVNTHLPLLTMVLLGCPTFVHGAIHWIGYRWNESVIIAFDVHEEIFLEIELPSAIVQESGYSLMADGESLYLLDNQCNGVSSAVPIWVMKKYGVKQSWSKQFIVEIHDYTFRVLGFRKHGQILLQKNKAELVSYDPKVQSTKLVVASQQCKYTVSKYDSAIPYVECLVLLKGSGRLEGHVDGPFSNC
ncbi:hypothetical protein SAY86_020199 [Trapa natans]|uniref:F-box associated beta-propeller type 3 domain-containing protein n=1 Tax=Trapa natans TaxID=22666 RepID=A0AAN7LN19_TRANT|nr:hypothetical protein SAY86_020199 [Trapa natans]